MAKYSNTVEYNLKTTLDASGVSKLQAELSKVQLELNKINQAGVIGEPQIEKAKAGIKEIQQGLNKAFNPNLGLLNIDKFINSLSPVNRSISEWSKHFETAGATGQQAMNSLIGRLGKIDSGLVSVSKTTDKVFNTIGNTVRWGLIASAFQTVMNNAHEAVNYIKELDRSLNDIRIVSDYNAQDMREFSLYANEAAKALGQTTVAYTDASLIFAQQGFNLDDANQLAEMTLKVANTTGQATDEVSEQITSWMNGYQMSLDQVGETLDKVTKVAAVGAADTEELMTAASKVASTANMLGVTEDQLITQMSTIISVTREAPENIGNSLKTIYARLGDLQMGETLEDGTSLGNLSSTLEKVGIQILDDTGAMRNMGDVLEELMNKWGSFDRAQQQALAVKLAGKYQYSRFSALMQNEEMYQSQLKESMESTGFLERTQDIYMESLAAKSKSMQAATEGLISNLFDPDAIKPFQQGLIDSIDLLSSFVDVAGGGVPVLGALATSMGRVFSKQIGTGINSMINNRELASEQRQTERARQLLFQNGADLEQTQAGSSLMNKVQGSVKYTDRMSTEQVQQYNEALEQSVQIENSLIAAKEKAKELDRQAQHILQDKGYTDTQFRNENKEIDVAKLDKIQAELAIRQDQNNSTALLAQDLNVFMDELTAGQSVITEFKDGLITMGTATKDVNAIVKEMPVSYDLLEKSIPVKDFEAFKKNQVALEKELGKTAPSIDKVSNLLSKNGMIIYDNKTAIDKLIKADRDVLRINQEQISSIRELANAEAQAALDTEQWAQRQANLQRQMNIQNVVNMTAAVGQLGFAITSISNLGDIWTEEDVSVGNKLLQTLMNLTITIPMLVSSIPAITQGISSIKKLTNGNNLVTAIAIALNKKLAASNVEKATSELNAAKASVEEYKAIMNELRATGKDQTENAALIRTKYELAEARLKNAKAAQTEAASEAAEAASGSTKGLGGRIASSLKGFAKSFGPMLAATAAITIGAALVNGAIEANQKAWEASKEQADKGLEEFSSVKESVSNFDALYEEYKKTGDASTEFIDSSKKITQELNISGGEALIAAENFGILAERIHDAQDAAEQDALNDIGGFLRGAGKDATTGGFFKNGQLFDSSAKEDIKNKLNVYDYIADPSEYSAGALVNNDLGKKIDNADTLSKIVGIAKSEIDNYNKEIADIDQQIKNAKSNNEDTSALEAQKDSILRTIGSINETLNAEETSEYMSKLGEAAQLSASQVNQELDATMSASEIFSKFQNNDYTGEFLESFGSWSEQLSWMIQNTTNEIAKQTLLLEKSYVDLGEKSYNWGKELAENNLLVTTENNEFTNNSSEDIGTAFQKYIEQDIKNSGMTEDQQIQFIASIDEKTSVHTILKQLEDIKNNPELNNELTFQTSLTNRIDYSEDQISQLVKDSGMSDNAFNRMTKDMYEDDQGYFQNRSSELKSDIENINDTNFKDYVQNAENAEEATILLKKELSSLGDEAKDSAATNLRLNKGVAALTDNWEDLGSVLKDSASKGTSDWYEAVGQLDEAMSDILNIDIGSLSNEFYEDAEAIEAMERAANGDMDAIDDLRRIANEDIIMHMQVSDISTDDLKALREQLLAESQALQAELDAMPLEQRVTTNLDDSEYVTHLNQLLQDSQITAEQATQALSSIGMSGRIEYLSAKVTVPEYTYHMEGSLKNLLSGEGSSDVRVSTYQSGVKEFDGLVPQLIGTHYNGPGITTVGGKSSGKLGNSGGGGGKGGGSGKSYEPKKKDPIEEEIDRYERVDTLLGAIEKDYDKINNERDRLAGWNIADNMNKEIDLLQKQILLHEEKLKIQREEQKELANDLANKYGGRFDADGFLTNYEAIHRKLESDVNNLINQYNNTSDEAGQEALEEQIEAAQKVLDSFKEDYKRYDELVSSDLKETINTIEDLKDSIEDLRIEAFQTQIEAADNIKDINESLIDFNAVLSGLDKDDPFRGMATSAAKLKNYFDDAGGAVEDYYDKLIARSKEALNDPAITDAYRTYLTEQISLMEQAKAAAQDGNIEQYGLGYLDMAFTNLNTITDQIKQFQKTGSSAIFGEDEGDMYEVAKDVFDQAVQMVEDLEDAIGDLRNSIIDGIDDIGERIEERQNQYENITEELEHQRDIIELLHGDRSYQEINMVLSAQQNNYQQSIKEMQESLELWKDLREGLIEGSEEWKAVNEQIEETQKELNDLVEESLNNLREQYENTVNDILDSWSNSPFGNDLDWIEEEWELINRNADYYLDQTNAAYETQKLQGEYLKLLDGSNDLHIQQLISEQMKEQLGYLREKKNISEYDVAYANAQLEILQKRIALEEAQRNKNQIKLRRDSQGNYSYVYTADQDDIADKEGDLLDAKNNAYNLSKEQMKQTQADSLSALGDAKNLLNNIWNDANLTLEEKKKRTETVINSLKEYLDGTSEQLSTSQKNIINDFIGMVDMMTDENSERLKDVYTEIINGNHDAFDQIDTRWSTSLTDWLQNLDEFKDNTDKAFEDLTNNADEYQNQIDQVGDLIKTDFDDMATSVENVKNKTDDLAASQKDFINQLKNDAGTIKEYEKTLGEYTAKISDAENAMKAYKDQVNELGNTIKAKEQENAALTSQVKDLQSTVNAYKEGTIGGGSGGGGGNYGGHNLNEMAEGVAGNIWVYGGWGNNPRRHSLMKQKFGDAAGDQLYAAVQAKFNSGYGYRGGLEHSWSYYKSFYPSNFDTGGYTGTWANGDTDGRLAMLHQKEIILNATDTANLLQVVQTVRDMTSQMKGSLLGNIVELMQNNSPIAKDTNDTLQQEVHITAEFPNVESSDEIREALLGLNDQAMQYAARER